MKKGRHRRYEEARKFQRDNASAFSVEDFDFEDKNPWGPKEEDLDDSYEHLADKYDEEAALAAKYADFDTSSERTAPPPPKPAEDSDAAEPTESSEQD
ncbi:MAG: hypothetical protein ACI8Y4_004923 [Candidatus Poriferisodalaceae bacterium]